MATSNPLRDWARKQQQQVDQYNRRVKQANAEQKRAIEQHNRRVQQEQQRRANAFNNEVARVNSANRRVITEHNQQISKVNQRNKQVDAQNAKTIAELNRRAGQTVRYTSAEEELVRRVNNSVTVDEREFDAFLSYAHIDGGAVANELAHALEDLGVRVWIDDVMVPGQSMARQMDRGLSASRCGIALLTPAYITGRFWTERELGALLHKKTLVPVLHQVSFDDVQQFSGFLGDLLGFETQNDSIEDLASKIASAVLPAAAV